MENIETKDAVIGKDAVESIVIGKDENMEMADRVLAQAHELYGRDTISTEVIAATARNLLYATCHSFENAADEAQKQYATLMVIATETILGIVTEKIESLFAASEQEDD